jgi:hypothetical protein
MKTYKDLTRTEFYNKYKDFKVTLKFFKNEFIFSGIKDNLEIIITIGDFDNINNIESLNAVYEFSVVVNKKYKIIDFEHILTSASIIDLTKQYMIESYSQDN